MPPRGRGEDSYAKSNTKASEVERKGSKKSLKVSSRRTSLVSQGAEKVQRKRSHQ
ncbi:MAG: hypothetical protein P4M11_03105 [Candidatus Pacebacteria bacterium]|nr:hypothetical protein [Candidatus Paceibacterota bacterium]